MLINCVVSSESIFLSLEHNAVVVPLAFTAGVFWISVSAVAELVGLPVATVMKLAQKVVVPGPGPGARVEVDGATELLIRLRALPALGVPRRGAKDRRKILEARQSLYSAIWDDIGVASVAWSKVAGHAESDSKAYWTDEQVAAEYGLTPETVVAVAKKHGICPDKMAGGGS